MYWFRKSINLLHNIGLWYIFQKLAVVMKNISFYVLHKKGTSVIVNSPGVNPWVKDKLTMQMQI